jgi:hypothetical protein
MVLRLVHWSVSVEKRTLKSAARCDRVRGKAPEHCELRAVLHFPPVFMSLIACAHTHCVAARSTPSRHPAVLFFSLGTTAPRDRRRPSPPAHPVERPSRVLSSPLSYAFARAVHMICAKEGETDRKNLSATATHTKETIKTCHL